NNLQSNTFGFLAFLKFTLRKGVLCPDSCDKRIKTTYQAEPTRDTTLVVPLTPRQFPDFVRTGIR
ncbi:MAG TPA: hypothetical protein VKA22_02105, partial [Desulfuromonadales bacterium]|nr:hypothetical protein [Desulfuromonadales bacterium]